MISVEKLQRGVYDEHLHNTAQDMKYYNVHSASKRAERYVERVTVTPCSETLVTAHNVSLRIREDLGPSSLTSRWYVSAPESPDMPFTSAVSGEFCLCLSFSQCFV